MRNNAFFLILVCGAVGFANPELFKMKSTDETTQSSPESPRRMANPFPTTPHAFARYINAREGRTQINTHGEQSRDTIYDLNVDSLVRVFYLRNGLYVVRSPFINPARVQRNYRIASAVGMLEKYGPKYKGHYIVERTDYRTLRYFKGGGRAPKLSDEDKRTIRARAGFLILDDEGRKVYDAYKARIREEHQAELDAKAEHARIGR